MTDTTGVLDVHADSPIVGTLAELALFAVLFTDGMRVGWADLRSAWRLPGRALGWGLPLTLLVTAVAAHFVAGLGWPESLLIGAILAPTDPVFASALVGNDKVPARLRHLLNVESGVNDGLALPFVIVFLAVVSGSSDLHLGELAWEVSLGLLIGVAIPVGAILLERSRFFSASPAYEPLNGLAIGLLVLAVAQATHANLFLAGFAAGITVATFGPRQRVAFEHFGENIAELFKLAALLVFGALISPEFPGRDLLAGVGLRDPRDLRGPSGGAVAVVPAFRPRPAGAGGRDVVRAERVRLGGLRSAGPRVRRRRGGHDLPPGGVDDRVVDRAALLHRRGGGPRLRRRGRDAGLARQTAADDPLGAPMTPGSMLVESDGSGRRATVV